MVKYKDLINIMVKDSKEPFVVLGRAKISFGYFTRMSDMKKPLGNKILVRRAVYTKLKLAQKLLKKVNPSLSLYVCYGYRSLEIQTKLFLKELSRVGLQSFYLNPVALYEKVHEYIAVPTVAGHPTGGAVDLLIIDTKKNRFLDFGSEIYNFKNDNCKVFSRNILKTAKDNRYLLRNVMVKSGFAPYDGEWWHFSYGDREWAYYYKKPKAIYDQVVNPFPESRSRLRRRPI